jgi:hypothetical protein
MLGYAAGCLRDCWTIPTHEDPSSTIAAASDCDYLPAGHTNVPNFFDRPRFKLNRRAAGSSGRGGNCASAAKRGV